MTEKKKLGFATMDPDTRREIASRGGRVAQSRPNPTRWTKEAAVLAGKKGGAKISANREHMAEIGKKGGKLLSEDREHMAAIGRKGGAAVAARKGHMRALGQLSGKARAAKAAEGSTR